MDLFRGGKRKQVSRFAFEVTVKSFKDRHINDSVLFVEWKRGRKQGCLKNSFGSDGEAVWNESFRLNATMCRSKSDADFDAKILTLYICARQVKKHGDTKKIGCVNIDLSKFCNLSLDNKMETHSFTLSKSKSPYEKGIITVVLGCSLRKEGPMSEMSFSTATSLTAKSAGASSFDDLRSECSDKNDFDADVFDEEFVNDPNDSLHMSSPKKNYGGFVPAAQLYGESDRTTVDDDDDDDDLVPVFRRATRRATPDDDDESDPASRRSSVIHNRPPRPAKANTLGPPVADMSSSSLSPSGSRRHMEVSSLRSPGDRSSVSPASKSPLHTALDSASKADIPILNLPESSSSPVEHRRSHSTEKSLSSSHQHQQQTRRSSNTSNSQQQQSPTQPPPTSESPVVVPKADRIARRRHTTALDSVAEDAVAPPKSEDWLLKGLDEAPDDENRGRSLSAMSNSSAAGTVSLSSRAHQQLVEESTRLQADMDALRSQMDQLRVESRLMSILHEVLRADVPSGERAFSAPKPSSIAVSISDFLESCNAGRGDAKRVAAEIMFTIKRCRGDPDLLIFWLNNVICLSALLQSEGSDPTAADELHSCVSEAFNLLFEHLAKPFDSLAGPSLLHTPEDTDFPECPLCARALAETQASHASDHRPTHSHAGGDKGRFHRLATRLRKGSELDGGPDDAPHGASGASNGHMSDIAAPGGPVIRSLTCPYCRMRAKALAEAKQHSPSVLCSKLKDAIASLRGYGVPASLLKVIGVALLWRVNVAVVTCMTTEVGMCTWSRALNLKMSVGTVEEWGTGSLGLTRDTVRRCLRHALQAADAIVLDKNALLDTQVRASACPDLSPQVLSMLLKNFAPDENAPEPVPPDVLSAFGAMAATGSSSLLSRDLSSSSSSDVSLILQSLPRTKTSGACPAEPMKSILEAVLDAVHVDPSLAECI
eukprot:Rmarinus@m.10985